MRLKEILCQEAIISELRARTREEVLKELVDALPDGLLVEREKLFRILKEREEQSSTAIGGGVAVPHGRVAGLEKLILSVGVSKSGVDFGAPDQKPTHIFFLLFAPQEATSEHLRVLARIARLCQLPDLISRLLSARSPEEVYQILSEEDDRL